MQNRAFIVAPNIGLHMGTGGGVRVALAMAKILEELGYEPYLIALRGYDLRKLFLTHGIKLCKSRPLYLLGEGEPLRIPFPVQVLLLQKFLRKALSRFKPKVVLFNDDIPIMNEMMFYEAHVILYSHFPYAAKIKFNITDVYEVSPSKREVCLEVLYRRLSKKMIYMDYVPPNVTLVSNSTITRIFMKMLWCRDPLIVYPPLIVTNDVKVLPQDKEDCVLVLATIQPNKRIGDVIRAFSQLKDVKARLVIVGHKGPSKYKEYLNGLIRKLKVRDKVKFLIDIDETRKWNLLARSKVIVSAAHFEPFGINVVEGMYMNNIPIVYRGSLSGPWIDIVGKGKHGLGFRNVEELTELMNVALQDYNYILQKLDPAVRAKRFRYENFKEHFIRIL